MKSEPTLHNQHLMSIHERPDEVFVRGEGACMWDAAGKRYLDWLPGIAKARLNDLSSVIAAINEHTVAVLLKLVQGEAGVPPASPAFMQALRALCDERDLLLALALGNDTAAA